MKKFAALALASVVVASSVQAQPARQGQTQQALLPNLFLIDVVSGRPRRFRFRLVGTRIVELEGEITNKFLDELISNGPETAAMARHYDDATEGRLYVRRETLGWHPRERAHVNYDVLLLPLSRDGETVDMLFGFCAYHVA